MAIEMIRKDLWIPETLADWRRWNPGSELGKVIRKCLCYLPAELAAELIGRVSSCVVLESQLSLVIYRTCPRCGLTPAPQDHFGLPRLDRCRCSNEWKLIEDYGVVSHKLITTAGVNFLVDAWQNLVELEIMRYHGIGTSNAAEAVGQTALTTELAAQYNPNNTRATGSLTEGASANIFRSVGTNTVDADVTIEEHGLLSQAATGGGTLWDRSLTDSRILLSGNSLVTTYDLTCSAGG